MNKITKKLSLSLSTLMMLIGANSTAQAFEVQLINAASGVYDFGLLSTNILDAYLPGDILNISIAGMTGSDVVASSLPGNGNYSPTLQASAVGAWTAGGATGDFTSSSIFAGTVDTGISTFRIFAPEGASVANVSLNSIPATLDNSTVALPVGNISGGGGASVPFEFSTIPGLIAFGTIFGFNLWQKRKRHEKL